MAVDKNYQLQKGESREAYNKRIASYNSTKGTSSSGTGSSTDPLLSELQKRLMKQSDVISSSDSGIEKTIKDSISGIQKGRDANTARIESVYDRERGYLETDSKDNLTEFTESRSGFGTQMVALRKLVETTDKNFNDLEMRKEELILQGDSNAASQIADLQLKGLQFKQDAEQRVFTNLLSLSNFGLALKQDQRAQQGLDLQTRQQNFMERSKLAEIGLEFGVPVGENDTLDTMITKAAPFASEERKLEIEKMRADIANANAQAQRALTGDPVVQLTPDAAYLTMEWIMGNDPTAFLKLDPKIQNQIAPYRKTIQTNQKIELEALSGNMDNEEFLEHVNSSGKTYDDAVVQQVYEDKYLNASEADTSGWFTGIDFSTIKDKLFPEMSSDAQRRRFEARFK
jgi:hypothetical protein